MSKYWLYWTTGRLMQIQTCQILQVPFQVILVFSMDLSKYKQLTAAVKPVSPALVLCHDQSAQKNTRPQREVVSFQTGTLRCVTPPRLQAMGWATCFPLHVPLTGMNGIAPPHFPFHVSNSSVSPPSPISLLFFFQDRGTGPMETTRILTHVDTKVNAFANY